MMQDALFPLDAQPRPLADFLPTALGGDTHYQVHQPHCAVPGKYRAPIGDRLHQPATEPTNYFRIKTVVDPSITAALMLVALPLMLLLSLIILVCDGRPVFYRQVRVGKQGRPFRIWKFRTMRRNAEQETGAVWSSGTDPRVTRLGRWLRCSHLDELPQFLNILVGDMNLIGPRPERPEFVVQLADTCPDYNKRTKVRPGITGLAQLRLGYDESIAGIPQKVAYDLHYIRTASFLRDVALLTGTLPHIVRQLYHKWASDRCRHLLPATSAQREQAFSIQDLPRNSRETSMLNHRRYVQPRTEQEVA